MNEFEKAQIIMNERDGLRQQQTSLLHAAYYSVLTFLLAFAGALATYFNNTLAFEKYRFPLFLSLAQIEVLLFLLIITLLSLAHIAGGYIAGLEHKLNMLAKDNVNIWESKICPKYLISPFRPSFISYILQCIGYSLAFGVLIYFSFGLTILWGVILTSEAITIIALFLWSLHQQKEVEDFAKKQLINGDKAKQ